MKKHLEKEHLPDATTVDWEKKAEDFWERWDFPNCVGALDGKHVRIVAPDCSGSLFYNFKIFFLLFSLHW